MNKYTLIILLFIITSFLYPDSIKGYVVDGTTGEPLPYSNIWIDGTVQGTTSNSDGYFVLTNIPNKDFTLIVSYIGYNNKSILIEKNDEKISIISIKLEPRVLIGEGVTVEGEHTEVFQMNEDSGHMTLSMRELQTMPVFGEVDIFNALKLLPGISGIGDGKAGVYVRGGTPDQNLVTLDGMTVYHVDHFFGMFSAFNADAIKDVQVYKGGFPAKYGGRLSSVLELTGKRGGDELTYSFGANLLSANFSFEAPLLNNKANWIINARRSYTDILQTPIYSDIYEFVTGEESNPNSQSNFQGGSMRGGAFQQNVVPSFYYYDLNSKLSYNPTERDILSLSFYSGKDFLDKSRELDFSEIGGGRTLGGMEFETRTDENVSSWGNIGASFKWGHQWDLLYTNILLSGSQFESTYERNLSVSGSNTVGTDSLGAARGLGAFAQNEYNTVQDIALRIDNQIPIGKNHNVEFGIFLNNIATDYDANVRDTLSVLLVKSQSDIATVYLQDKWKPIKRLDLLYGIRSTYFDQTQSMYYEPRVSFGIKVSPLLRIKGAWGQYYQFINTITNENVLEGSREFWLSSNENILPGFAKHFSLGVSYNTSKYLFEIEGYYKNLNNLVEFSRRFQEQADYANYFFFGEGVARGIELLAQKKYGALTGWISYTLGEVENTFLGLNDGEPFHANHDRTHELKIVGRYKYKDWTFSTTYVYATGNPYTSPQNQYYLTMLDGEELSYIHVGEKNSFRLPDYNRLDISASRSWQTEYFNIEGGLSLYNALNNQNVYYRDYDLDVTPIIATDVTMLGFTPTIFINFRKLN